MSECHHGPGPHADRPTRRTMKRRRTRVQLTAADWRRIYDAVAFVRAITATAPTARDCLLVLRKIGACGMAARDRGVAPVTRRR